MDSSISTSFVSFLIFSLTSASADQREITAKPGEDVTLLCRSPRGEAVTLFEWSRPELKSDGYVFFYRNKHSYENYQHPSFHGRVQLTDPEMKDGDVSVILKNVTIKDTGTYKCRVSVNSEGLELINTTNLKVKGSDQRAITAKSGEDVTLPCWSPSGEAVTLLEWSRPELKKDGYVFLYRDESSQEDYQHPTARGRVQLTDPEMKDGNVSVILKNVNINDAGTYECRIIISNTGGRDGDLVEAKNIIHLNVTGAEKQRGHTGMVVGLSVTGVVLLLLLGIFSFIYNRKRKEAMRRNSHQRPPERENVPLQA